MVKQSIMNLHRNNSKETAAVTQVDHQLCEEYFCWKTICVQKHPLQDHLSQPANDLAQPYQHGSWSCTQAQEATEVC